MLRCEGHCRFQSSKRLLMNSDLSAFFFSRSFFNAFISSSIWSITVVRVWTYSSPTVILSLFILFSYAFEPFKNFGHKLVAFFFQCFKSIMSEPYFAFKLVYSFEQFFIGHIRMVNFLL